MAHTAKYLEGALYQIMVTNLQTFGVKVIDSYQDPDFPQVMNAIGPASQVSVRIRMGICELYRVNTLAQLTLVQLQHFTIDCWRRTTDGASRQDNDGGLVARVWQLINGLSEAANVGDVNWNNITSVKILSAEPPNYGKGTGIQHRILHGAATWN